MSGSYIRPDRPLLPKERQEEILARVRRVGAVRVAELVADIGVSDMTVRRDISELAERGFMRKVHGGAVEITEPNGRSREKIISRLAEKQAIAGAAYRHLRPGSTIAMSVGTSTRMIAQRITEDGAMRPLVVVTNSLEISDLLASSTDRDLETIVIGGFRTANDSLVGPLAVEAIAKLRVDQLYLGVHGISVTDGLSTPNLMEAETDRAMIASAASTIVLADHHKWNLVGLGVVAPLGSVDILITDSGTPEETIRLAEQEGLTVETVGPHR